MTIEVFTDGPGMGYQAIRRTAKGTEISADIYFSRSEAKSAIRNKRIKWELVIEESDS